MSKHIEITVLESRPLGACRPADERPHRDRSDFLNQNPRRFFHPRSHKIIDIKPDIKSPKPYPVGLFLDVLA
ncbi:MAG TPA: hypothetical protein PKB02_09595 [Anaerohalosphaeraceae bacterium]|nr:hypothetical protein [Anaerohalosphaeraceae bacterium]